MERLRRDSKEERRTITTLLHQKLPAFARLESPPLRGVFTSSLPTTSTTIIKISTSLSPNALTNRNVIFSFENQSEDQSIDLATQLAITCHRMSEESRALSKVFWYEDDYMELSQFHQRVDILLQVSLLNRI